MYFHYLTFQIASYSAIEVGVGLLIVGGALYNWYNRTPIPTNPILPTTLDMVPAAPEPFQETDDSPPSEATDGSLLDVVVTDPIEQIETFWVLEYSKVQSMSFYPDFIQILS